MLELMGSTSVPQQTRDNIAGFAATAYFYSDVSAAFKAQLVAHFSQHALQPDPDIAEAAFRGLARIARDAPSGRIPLPPDTLISLTQSYRALLQKGRMKPNQPLEQALSMALK